MPHRLILTKKLSGANRQSAALILSDTDPFEIVANVRPLIKPDKPCLATLTSLVLR
jgi:hypothetical protein